MNCFWIGIPAKVIVMVSTKDTSSENLTRVGGLAANKGSYGSKLVLERRFEFLTIWASLGDVIMSLYHCNWFSSELVTQGREEGANFNF
jgi:hypothetical protein